MLAQELIDCYSGDSGTERFEVVFKAVDSKKQIVEGEVYTPYMLDSHDEMMLPEAVQTLAHRFLGRLLNNQIDLMHNNKVVNAVVVESFIARKDDPLYNEGAWVLATKIEDPELWAAIENGEYNGYSMEAMVTKVDAEAEFDYFPQVFGFTEKADGHEHVFFIQHDDNGNIVGGTTSVVNGHSHSIKYATATEFNSGHAHRFLLP